MVKFRKSIKPVWAHATLTLFQIGEKYVAAAIPRDATRSVHDRRLQRRGRTSSNGL